VIVPHPLFAGVYVRTVCVIVHSATVWVTVDLPRFLVDHVYLRADLAVFRWIETTRGAILADPGPSSAYTAWLGDLSRQHPTISGKYYLGALW